jgi:hypothetical protein
MRTLLLALSLLSFETLLGQCCTGDSLYLMLDTSRVKWDRRSVPCVSDHVALKWVYVLQEADEHLEFARLSHRLVKSQRRYSRTLWWFYSNQERRRLARWEKFMVDHTIGTMDLTDGLILILKEANRPAKQETYRLFGEQHQYSLIKIDALLVTMLGGASYRLSPMN